MFSEQWSLIIVNTLSLVAWAIDIIAFCSTTKKNNLILRGTTNLINVIVYGLRGLWYPCVANIAKCLIFLYNALFKFYNLTFTFIISLILILFNIMKIRSINNINIDNAIPIISFLFSIIGVSFCKSVHSIRITKGMAALLYVYYNIKHTIIFSAAQGMFVVLLMIADILINKLDKKSKTAEN